MKTELRFARLAALWGAVFSAIVAFAALAWAWLAPPSRWLDVRSVTILDASEGQPITLAVDRTIGRGGPGQFLVVARRRTPTGWLSVCETPWIAFVYRPGADLPQPVTLDWWTRGQLHDVAGAPCRITAGEWEIETTWRMEPPGYPDKVLTVRAPFTVWPRS